MATRKTKKTTQKSKTAKRVKIKVQFPGQLSETRLVKVDDVTEVAKMLAKERNAEGYSAFLMRNGEVFDIEDVGGKIQSKDVIRFGVATKNG